MNVGIEKWSSLHALGYDNESGVSVETGVKLDKKLGYAVAKLHKIVESNIKDLEEGDRRIKDMDRTTKMAILVALNLLKDSNYKGLGLGVGSSRGATQLWEKWHNNFVDGKKLSPKTSPLTTLGQMATGVAQYVGNVAWGGETSMACNSGMQALFQGLAWIGSGMGNKWVAIGTEAALTEYTLEMLRGMGIYSMQKNEMCEYWSMPWSGNGTGMVLGEGAAGVLLSEASEKTKVVVAGIGYSMEDAPSASGVSKSGRGLEQSMQMAMKNAGMTTVDLLIPHATGTFKGDQSEWNAVQRVFEGKTPHTWCNKWKYGHTLGASAMLSVCNASDILCGKLPLKNLPYTHYGMNPIVKNKINCAMVNSTGFGGMNYSLVLQLK